MLIVGVDSGATRTRALASREDGTSVGKAAAGPGNPHHIGPGPAAAEIARAIREAASGENPDIVVAGVAGLEDPELKRELRYALEALRPANEIHLFSDAAIALDGAFLGGSGVIVISGTGSVAWGRSAKGDEARAGGWGHLINDAGSGYDIGRRGVNAALRGHDGRGEETALFRMLLKALDVETAQQMAGLVWRMDASQVASLARMVVQAAEEGDAAARTIVRNAAAELAALAAAVWQKLNLGQGQPVAPVGGMFNHARIQKAFTVSVARKCPEAIVVPPRLPPAAGALWRALLLKGYHPGEPIISQLAALAKSAE
jgi:glucosamine kinase